MMQRALISILIAWVFHAATPTLAQNVGPYGAKRSEDKVVTQSVVDSGVTLAVTIQKATYDLAETIVIDYQITTPEDAVAVPLSFDDQIGPFTLLDFTPLAQQVDGTHRRWFSRLRLDAPHVGTLVVPPFSALVQLAAGRTVSLATQPVPIAITTFLPPNADIRGVKESFPPVPLPPQPVNWLPWFIAGAVVLVVLLAVVIYWLAQQGVFRRRQAVLPLDQEFLVELQQLESDAVGDDRAVRAYYERLHSIVRRYLDRRWQIPALSRTTPEVSATLQASKSANDNDLIALLGQCDRVKFARRSLARPERQSDLQTAQAYVRATAPPPDGAAGVS